MKWPIDDATRAAARSFPLHIKAQQPKCQFSGRNFVYASWQRHLRAQDKFPPRPATGYPTDPMQIISEFQAGHYLPGLALTVSWGNMARTKRHIYEDRPLQRIHDTLDQCGKSIRKTESISDSWNLLTDDLQWSSVITSKTLHFLCRALGFIQDAPVPIDHAGIRKKVWPLFRNRIPPEQRPGDWEGNSFEAYCRYMTAILTWADARGWTTSQVETTIFDEN